jgi:hypothetical protein
MEERTKDSCNQLVVCAFLCLAQRSFLLSLDRDTSFIVATGLPIAFIERRGLCECISEHIQAAENMRIVLLFAIMAAARLGAALPLVDPPIHPDMTLCVLIPYQNLQAAAGHC